MTPAKNKAKDKTTCERLKNNNPANAVDHPIYTIDSYAFAQGACPEIYHRKAIPKVNPPKVIQAKTINILNTDFHRY